MAKVIIGFFYIILLGLLFVALWRPAKVLPFIKTSDTIRRIIIVVLWLAVLHYLRHIVAFFFS